MLAQQPHIVKSIIISDAAMHTVTFGTYGFREASPRIIPVAMMWATRTGSGSCECMQVSSITF